MISFISKSLLPYLHISVVPKVTHCAIVFLSSDKKLSIHMALSHASTPL